MITPEQIRGARAMLGLTQAELAKRAGISTTGLNNIERRGADSKASTLRAIREALESAGIEFTDGDQPGVRLGKAGARGDPAASIPVENLTSENDE
jgi:transcriptional regulator with XRE-family HTH domain